ncbi:DNRLRE domain-containing protein [Sansalvadorimonas sp. 2012CJ34-2]|uniref:DNRLRE domain-containing protein n=1 Tax=Parendozoicomonas callyspongiae TaxID=2942213 RepID=A0ABT0PEQ3_9GAMM|nr:DNRLRE domain-containing protein [Sansalvadorimonas sp. 2012CJ34-2]MCL6269257.1 DNRLRE domain-containing protein [Sansalvadorimonas sp. 2012CJ34-2]
MFKICKTALTLAAFLTGTAAYSSLPVEQDAYVRGGFYKTINYPHKENLVVKNSSDESYSRSSLLKFRPRDITNINKGILHLHLARTGATKLLIEEINNSWEDTHIDWETQPETEDTETTFFRIDTPQVNKWVRIDISNLLADKKFSGSLRIRNDNKTLVLISAQESGKGAYLELK